MAAQRLLILGAGKKDKFGTVEPSETRGRGSSNAEGEADQKSHVSSEGRERSAEWAQSIVEGMIWQILTRTSTRLTRNRGMKSSPRRSLAGKSLHVAMADRGLERGRLIGESQNFARELGNEPANLLTPRLLASRAEAMAREAGLSVDILDEKKIAELKMGALLSVAQGSVEPPRLIVVTYTPEKLKPGTPVLGLVGKAITFDTGGISIKPANDMEKMKYDMCGGAAMLGAMRAIARLKPSCKVICRRAVQREHARRPGAEARRRSDWR